MKKRISKLEDKQPELDHKERLIEAGERWMQAVLDDDREAAVIARNDAEPLFEQLPEYLEETPYCGKMLYINWERFCNYLNPDEKDNF